MPTKAMRVANEGFLLDRLAADAPRSQMYRELTQNSLEAIRRRIEAGDKAPGIIQWDVDWLGVPHGKFKLSVTDNGDGMSSDEMTEYLNSLAVKGANKTQSITENFGVGAKITALYHNKFGLQYLSWKGGSGNNVCLHWDEEADVYGLMLLHDKHENISYARALSSQAKPAIIEASGTKVVLLGNDDTDETWRKPAQMIGGDTNWLYKYLNTRYFRLPDWATIQVRSVKLDPESWPEEEPPNHGTYGFEIIKGMKNILDSQVENEKSGSLSCSGTVRLSEVDVHWWLFEDKNAVSKSINPRATPPGHVGVVFQNEVYMSRTNAAARKIMALFGLYYGSDHVVLYIEPRTSALDINADTARSRLLVDGEDIDSSDRWSRWGDEFREKMPEDILAFTELLLSAASDSDKEDRRKRILERLDRIKELLQVPKYRKSSTGSIRATSPVSGGSAQQHTARPANGTAPPGGKGGRGSSDYLSTFSEDGGERAERINPKFVPPEVQWVSESNGTRAEAELEDRAAELPGDPLRSPVIKLNEDFRGFQDLIAYFIREFNADGEDIVVSMITKVVREWVETQVLEIVMAARSLEGNAFWDKSQLEQALSLEALTTAVMGRYFVVERVRRVLGSELSAAKRRQATPAAA